MRITVVLCTYNRCDSLRTSLNSLAAQILPESVQWEVLVVDNNSCDLTREVAKDFCCIYPGRFRYIFEPRPGKSHALNVGVREARGDVLTFIDDDVTVEPTWLQNLTAALYDGKWAGAGGRILPDPTFSPPRWLPVGDRYALAPLALFDLGPDAGQLTEPPFGTNMAFRKEMFEEYGGFRTDLGPRPGSMIRNEDTEFGHRLCAAGELLRYEPSAIVYHPVPDDRIQKSYFLAWWFAKGRADIRQFGPRPSSMFCCWGIPLYLFRNIAVWTVRWMVAFKPRARFQRKLKVWGKLGEIVECYRKSRAVESGVESNAGNQ